MRGGNFKAVQGKRFFEAGGEGIEGDGFVELDEAALPACETVVSGVGLEGVNVEGGLLVGVGLAEGGDGVVEGGFGHDHLKADFRCGFKAIGLADGGVGGGGAAEGAEARGVEGACVVLADVACAGFCKCGAECVEVRFG